MTGEAQAWRKRGAGSDGVALPRRNNNWKETIMAERFERHRQAWTSEEIQKLHLLAKKGMPLKQIAKALTRSEESTKDRAKADGVGIARLR
jgi:DNA-binding NarL/FixJ family response regulator